MTRSLVLSGGGRAGAAWILGMLDGLRRHCVDLGEADLIVGTSAGALAGEALAGGGLKRALRLHRESKLPHLEVPASTIELMAAVRRAATGTADARDAVPASPAWRPSARG